MKINVTQKHIDNGVPNRPVGCPVALAIQEAILAKREDLGESDVYVSVGDGYVDFVVEGVSFYAHLPTRVVKFIVKVDAKKVVLPITFLLDLSDITG